VDRPEHLQVEFSAMFMQAQIGNQELMQDLII
jgi:hypothetical protein